MNKVPNMQNALTNSVDVSRMSCSLFETGNKIHERIAGHHYVEIFLYNIALMRCAVKTIQQSDPSYTTPTILKQLLEGVVIVASAIVLGRYCEDGDASRIQHRIVRKVCVNLHRVSYLITVLALGILAIRSKWLELTVAVATFAAKYFVHRGYLPISQGTLEIGMNMCQFSVGCLVSPFDFATLDSAAFLLGVAANMFMQKRKAQYIWRATHFSSRKLPVHPTFEDPIWSSTKRIWSIYFNQFDF